MEHQHQHGPGMGIIKQLLTFGRGVESQHLPLSSHHMIEEMAQLIQETFPKAITLP